MDESLVFAFWTVVAGLALGTLVEILREVIKIKEHLCGKDK